MICTIGTIGVGIFVMDSMPLAAQKGLSITGMLHVIFGSSALMLLPFAALVINVNLVCRNPAWGRARRPLLWTAGLPTLSLAGFIAHMVIFLVPLGENAYGPGVPLGWPPRFLLLSYMVWLITLAWQAITLRRHDGLAAREKNI